MLLEIAEIQKKNRKNYKIHLKCDSCEKIYFKIVGESHASIFKNKKFHFCSRICTRTSLRKGKFRDEITRRLTHPESEKSCAVCGIKRNVKECDLSPAGFFFCSKKCVYDAQRKGGIIYEFRRRKCVEKHGVDFPMSSESIKEKRRLNVLAKHGVNSVFQLKSVKEKMSKTSIERYGVDVFSKTNDFKHKIKQTCFERFGFSSPIENPNILEKRRQTMNERWGGQSTFSSPVLRERMEQTMLEKYGYRMIAQVPTFISASMDKKMLKNTGKSWQQYIDDLPEFQAYRRKVDNYTRKQSVEILKNYDKRGEYHLDHKFSVAEGYRQGVDPKVIGNIVNLEYIEANKNIRKGSSCSISKNELLLQYYEANGLKRKNMNNKFGSKVSCYTAAGWFNPTQAEDLAKIESIIDSRSDWIDIKSPRRIFVCPPDAPQEVQEATFQGNLEHIKNADFVVASTVGPKVDVGTVWECGYAFAVNTPLVYICANLPKGMPFNLMLARSAVKVCLSYEQLEDYLDRCKDAGELLYEPYDKEIE